MISFVLLWSTTLPTCVFQLSKTKVQKWFPWRLNYSLGFSKSPIHCSSTLAGVSYSSLARLAELNKCDGRLALAGAIMSTRLVLKYSAYWPIYGLNTKYIYFTIGSLNPYEITPPQAIRTMAISRELQFARQHLCTDVFPLSMLSCGYIKFWHIQRSSFSIARRWNFMHFAGTSRNCNWLALILSLIHIWRCRRYAVCRSRWSPYY